MRRRQVLVVDVPARGAQYLFIVVRVNQWL